MSPLGIYKMVCKYIVYKLGLLNLLTPKDFHTQIFAHLKNFDSLNKILNEAPPACALTILESIMALAMNFPRKRNLEQTSSTMLNRVEGPRGQGKSPTGL